VVASEQPPRELLKATLEKLEQLEERAESCGGGIRA
jgi:hypothetical protein